MRGLLSNRGLVLLAIARRPDIRLREIAREVGITERAAQSMVSELVEGGHLLRWREGRRNHYQLAEPWSGRMTSVPDLMRALDGAGSVEAGDCRAVVLACSDHRVQPVLWDFLARHDLVGRAEAILWPGGGPALAGHDGPLLYRVLEEAVERQRPERLMYLSHAGCRVPDVPKVAGADPTATLRSVRRWARRVIGESERRLGLLAELWLIDRSRVVTVSWSDPRRSGAGLGAATAPRHVTDQGIPRRAEG